MAKEFVAHLTVVNGKFEWKNPDYIRVNLPKLEGKKGVLTIKEKWNQRSLPQNNYIHLCFEVIGEYMGENPNEVKRIMKGLFSPKVEKKFGDRRLMVPKGTSDMSVGEMQQFELEVSAEAGRLGVLLPDREEYNRQLDVAQFINE